LHLVLRAVSIGVLLKPEYFISFLRPLLYIRQNSFYPFTDIGPSSFRTFVNRDEIAKEQQAVYARYAKQLRRQRIFSCRIRRKKTSRWVRNLPI
jgi:hypothetical protein